MTCSILISSPAFGLRKQEARVSYKSQFYASFPMGPLVRMGDNDRPDIIVRFFHIFLVIIAIIGLIYLAYILFLKDLIILIRERQRRTQTTTGFGVVGNQGIQSTGV